MEVVIRPLNENDFVTRSRRELAMRKDPTDTYKRETIRTTFGSKDVAVDVVLRYPAGHEFGRAGFFVFACYDDNPAWHRRPETEWLEVAKRALTKFAAVRGRVVKLGPLPETGHALNLFIEMQGIAVRETADG